MTSPAHHPGSGRKTPTRDAPENGGGSAAIVYKIHTVLTDNVIQFTYPPRYADGPTARYMTHMFDLLCRENGIDHRLTKVKHP